MVKRSILTSAVSRLHGPCLVLGSGFRLTRPVAWVPDQVVQFQGGVDQLSKTLYVGNLPWSMTEEELAQAFSAHAQVLNARIITDRETGRSRGFGFVEVEDDDVEQAVEAMNGTQLNGRDIVVNEARPRQNRY